MSFAYTAEAGPRIVLALLKAHGIRKVIASPGTTNLTLVASMQSDPWFEMYSAADERSAAYIACGMAVASGEPVVITCTGATASRNYLPGLTEAYYRKLPVLAITANQGRGKIGHLVAQNIDRSTLPEDAACVSVDVPVAADEKTWRMVELRVNEAILALKRNGGGPAHIDMATTYSHDFSVTELPKVRVVNRVQPYGQFPELPKGRIAVFVGAHARWTPAQVRAVEAFCTVHDAVVFCDHTSGYSGKFRFDYALLAAQLQYSSSVEHVGLLIHIGEVSGEYYGMKLKPKEVWRVSPDGELRDTFGKLTTVFAMPEQVFFKHYAEGDAVESSFLALCRDEDAKVRGAIPELPYSNIWAAGRAAAKVPAGSVLHLGILNSLRAWNFFPVDAAVTTASNVGGFGIDGNLSSLIGASLARPDRLCFCVLGDLAFFYDMNSLGNRHVGSNVRIMLVNNGRGTEFRNFGHPGHALGEKADPYVAAAGHYGNMSPDLVKHYAQDLGMEYLSASSKEEFLTAAERFFTPDKTDRPMLLELFTDYKDESSALETMMNLITDGRNQMKRRARRIISMVAGEKGVALVKKMLRK